MGRGIIRSRLQSGGIQLSANYMLKLLREEKRKERKKKLAASGEQISSCQFTPWDLFSPMSYSASLEAGFRCRTECFMVAMQNNSDRKRHGGGKQNVGGYVRTQGSIPWFHKVHLADYYAVVRIDCQVKYERVAPPLPSPQEIQKQSYTHLNSNFFLTKCFKHFHSIIPVQYFLILTHHRERESPKKITK